MPPLTDQSILAQFTGVLDQWRYEGYVTSKGIVLDWIADNLGGLTLRDIAKAMHDHLAAGGSIDQVPEKREEWIAWPFHYDFRLELKGRRIYIETILNDFDPKDPVISIVSIHDA